MWQIKKPWTLKRIHNIYLQNRPGPFHFILMLISGTNAGAVQNVDVMLHSDISVWCAGKCEIFDSNGQAKTGNACLNVDILSPTVANGTKKKCIMQELCSPFWTALKKMKKCFHTTLPMKQTQSSCFLTNTFWFKQCSDLKHFCHASTVTVFWGEICGQSFWRLVALLWYYNKWLDCCKMLQEINAACSCRQRIYEWDQNY